MAEIVDNSTLGDQPQGVPEGSVPQAAVEAAVTLASRKAGDILERAAAPRTVDSGAGATVTQRYVNLDESLRAVVVDEAAGVRVTITVSPL